MCPAHCVFVEFYVLFAGIVPISAFVFPFAFIKHAFVFSAPGQFVLFFTIFVGGFHERNPISYFADVYFNRQKPFKIYLNANLY